MNNKPAILIYSWLVEFLYGICYIEKKENK